MGSCCDLNDQCALCLSPLGAKAGVRCSLDEIFHTPCNHWFHKGCIVKSRGSLCDNSHKCPMCRTALPKGLTPEQARNQRREPENGVFYRDLIISNSQRVREMMRQRLQGQVTANESHRNAAFPSPFRSASEALGDEVENIANAIMDIEVSEAPQETEMDEEDFFSGMCECNHCQRFCENGGRCGRCGEMYCRLCSVLNYDQRDERVFCLTCVAEQRELDDQMQ
ncbi:hypothetical protein CYMTET_36976 [Cymbomonas tetramitiformis]|uniref:RING-type domain-containing protein n=1 Tax=Cymbomonas tetramitiformis TaxID=36881 RepID=A0AAE0CEW0_9CHLO|nr:hypothetical protein CYMTET_36976 [Cymbomonas tetramitiformis]